MQLTDDFKKRQGEWLNQNPRALSLLYDLDLLPDQALSQEHEFFIQGVIFGLKVSEELERQENNAPGDRQ